MNQMTLQDILQPFSEPDFFGRVSGRDFLHIPGEQSKLSEIFSWSELNAIFQQNVPGLRLVKNCTDIPATEYCKAANLPNSSVREYCSPEAVSRLMQEGATLILPSIDRHNHAIARLARQLEQRFQTYVNVNLYATCAELPGFDTHWDDHDAFVLTISGAKRWSLFRDDSVPLTTLPNKNAIPPTEALWEATVTQGDVLYIPKGWWHRVLPTGEATIHLTFGLVPVTGWELFRWATDDLLECEYMTMEVPRFADPYTQETFVAAIRSKVKETLGRPELLQEFLKWRKVSFLNRPAFSFPTSLTPVAGVDPTRTLIEIASPEAVVPLKRKDGAEIEVLHEGKGYRFNEATEELFDVLRTEAPLSMTSFYESVAPRFEREEVELFIGDLAYYGLIVLSPMRA
jgi:hypothetical protein